MTEHPTIPTVPTRPAHPANMVVGRRGTPLPPDSQHFVLDLVYDYEARVAVSRLGRRYSDLGQPVRSQECFDALDATKEAHQGYMIRKNPKGKGKEKATSS